METEAAKAVEVVRSYINYVRDELDKVQSAYLELDHEARTLIGGEALSEQSAKYLLQSCSVFYGHIAHDLGHAVQSIDYFRENVKKQR